MSGGLWEREDVGWGGSPTARAPWDVLGMCSLGLSPSTEGRGGRKERKEERRRGRTMYTQDACIDERCRDVELIDRKDIRLSDCLSKSGRMAQEQTLEQ